MSAAMQPPPVNARRWRPGRQQRALIEKLSEPGAYVRRHFHDGFMRTWIGVEGRPRALGQRPERVRNRTAESLIRRGVLVRVADQTAAPGVNGRYVLARKTELAEAL